MSPQVPEQTEGHGEEEVVREPTFMKVGPAWEGWTLIQAVRRAFPEMDPRAVLRKTRTGEILLNGRRCRPEHVLHTGDVIRVERLRPAPSRRVVPSRRAESVETPAGSFWIVWEDPHLLVVSKPPRCASHPALGHAGNTLIERIHAYLGVKPEDPFRPALANRLDVDTSGIVLVAKTRPAQRRLGRNLQRGRVRKRYLVLVGGWPDPPKGEIRIPLVRRPDSRDRQRLPPGHPGLRGVLQSALTRYRTVARFRHPLRAALLGVELVTGRTHQIRRHLSAVGHPVAGDRRYGDPGFNRDLADASGLDRLFLHAYRVGLRHPASGEELDLVAPLPGDLVRVLRAFGAADVTDESALRRCTAAEPEGHGGKPFGDPGGPGNGT